MALPLARRIEVLGQALALVTEARNRRLSKAAGAPVSPMYDELIGRIARFRFEAIQQAAAAGDDAALAKVTGVDVASAQRVAKGGRIVVPRPAPIARASNTPPRARPSAPRAQH